MSSLINLEIIHSDILSDLLSAERLTCLITIAVPTKEPKEDATSVSSMDLNSGINGPLHRSGSVPSLDLKSFLPPNLTDERFDNMHQV